VINTGTTIVTFLMVFLIQNTQNRDLKAIQLKLDEIIRSIDNARNNLIDLEDVPDDEILRLEESYREIRQSEQDAEGSLQAAIEDQGCSNLPLVSSIDIS
jgi:low affinity Fe/Cu permease